jgi:protein SCO1/2
MLCRLKKPLLGAILLLALIAITIGLLQRPAHDNAALTAAGIILLPQPRSLPAITLTSTEEKPQPMTELKGQWTLLFFGYTFCPDICPTTLAELRKLKAQLPAETLARLRIIMISVDPHRDTPQQLRTYLDFYKAGYSGLTGELADIQKLSNATSIPFIPGDTSKAFYTVDHSGNLAIIGPDGRQRGFIRAPLDLPKLAQALPALLAGD